MSVSGFTMVRTRRQSITRDRATSAMRVASSARRGLTWRSRYNANCLRRKVLGGELDVRPQHQRHESEDVASDARNRAHVEPRTGLCHAVGCYRCWGSSN